MIDRAWPRRHASGRPIGFGASLRR
jgi:hypothetical protein